LRDDIQKLFAELFLLLEKKRNFFTQLNENSARIRYSGDHRIEGDISFLLKQNAQLIAEAGSLDAPIASKKRDICGTCGIGENEFNNYFKNTARNEFDQVETSLKEIEEQKKIACRHYEAICSEMETAVEKTQREISSLSRLREMMNLTDSE